MIQSLMIRRSSMKKKMMILIMTWKEEYDKQISFQNNLH